MEICDKKLKSEITFEELLDMIKSQINEQHIESKDQEDFMDSIPKLKDFLNVVDNFKTILQFIKAETKFTDKTNEEIYIEFYKNFIEFISSSDFSSKHIEELINEKLYEYLQDELQSLYLKNQNILLNEPFEIIYELSVILFSFNEILEDINQADLMTKNLNYLEKMKKEESFNSTIFDLVSITFYLSFKFYTLNKEKILEIYNDNSFKPSITNIKNIVLNEILNDKINDMIQIIDLFDILILIENYLDIPIGDKLIQEEFLKELSENYNDEIVSKKIENSINILGYKNKEDVTNQLEKIKYSVDSLETVLKEIQIFEEIIDNLPPEFNHPKSSVVRSSLSIKLPKSKSTMDKRRKSLLVMSKRRFHSMTVNTKFNNFYLKIAKTFNEKIEIVLQNKTDENCNKLIETLKSINVILDEKNYLINIIKDKILEKLVEIGINKNDNYNNACQEQAKLILNKILTFQEYLKGALKKEKYFVDYVIDEYKKCINIIINNLENLNNNNNKDKLDNVIYAVIEFSNNNEMIKDNLDIINLNSLIEIINKLESDPNLAQKFMQILHNFIQYSINNNEENDKKEENNQIILDLIFKFWNKYPNDDKIYYIVLKLMQVQSKDKSFLDKLLINNDILTKIINSLTNINNEINKNKANNNMENNNIENNNIDINNSNTETFEIIIEEMNIKEILLESINLINILIDNQSFLLSYLQQGYLSIIQLVNENLDDIKISENFLILYDKLINITNIDFQQLNNNETKLILTAILEEYMGTAQKEIIKTDLTLIKFYLEKDNKNYNFFTFKIIRNIFKTNKYFIKYEDICELNFEILNNLIIFSTKEIDKIKENMNYKPNYQFDLKEMILKKGCRSSYCSINSDEENSNLYNNDITDYTVTRNKSQKFGAESIKDNAYQIGFKVLNCDSYIDFITSIVQILSKYFKNENIKNYLDQIIHNLFLISPNPTEQQTIFNSIINALFKFCYIIVDQNDLEIKRNVLMFYLDTSYKFIIQYKNLIKFDLGPICSLIKSALKTNTKDKEMTNLLMNMLNKILSECDKEKILPSYGEIYEFCKLYRTNYSIHSTETLLLFQNILNVLSEMKSKILNENFIFLLETLLTSKDDKLLKSKNFKKILIKMSSSYFIERDEKAKQILKFLLLLFELYTKLEKNNFEDVTFIVKLISGLCYKTPLLKNEIKKTKFEIINKVKDYIQKNEENIKNAENNLEDNPDIDESDIKCFALLKQELDNCEQVLNTEKKYIEQSVEEQIKRHQRQQNFLLETIGNHRLNVFKSFLCEPIKINFYTKDKYTHKIYCNFDENLDILTAYKKKKNGEIKEIYRMKLENMDKCVPGKQNEIFCKKGIFGHKPVIANCLTIQPIPIKKEVIKPPINAKPKNDKNDKNEKKKKINKSFTVIVTDNESNINKIYEQEQNDEFIQQMGFNFEVFEEILGLKFADTLNTLINIKKNIDKYLVG